MSSRIVVEDVEYKKRQMKHNTDILALDGKWKAELAKAMITASASHGEDCWWKDWDFPWFDFKRLIRAKNKEWDFIYVFSVDEVSFFLSRA